MSLILGTKYFDEGPVSRSIHRDDLNWYYDRIKKDGYIKDGLSWNHPTLNIRVVESNRWLGDYKTITVYSW